MDQIFVINPKGGCGKTTIATQLAAHYAAAGESVLLADHDAQKSSSDWLSSRPDSVAMIRSIATVPEREIDAGDATLLIHDMPAAHTLKNIRSILHPGDRLLIPVLPSPTDIKACLRFIMALYREGLVDADVRVGLIANKVRRRTSYFNVLMAFLERVDLPLVGVIRETQNYVRVMDTGLSVFDMPSTRFQRDIEEWRGIFDWLDVGVETSSLKCAI